MKQTLKEAILEEQRTYLKQWRSANKERVKLANARYWQKRVEKKLAAQAAAELEGLNDSEK